jgi:hypothetical protein
MFLICFFFFFSYAQKKSKEEGDAQDESNEEAGDANVWFLLLSLYSFHLELQIR